MFGWLTRKRKERKRLILSHLFTEGTSSGQQLRDMLAAKGYGLSGPSFYSLMAKLEESGEVLGYTRRTVIDGEVLFPRWYVVE